MAGGIAQNIAFTQDYIGDAHLEKLTRTIALRKLMGNYPEYAAILSITGDDDAHGRVSRQVVLTADELEEIGIRLIYAAKVLKGEVET